MTQSKFPKPRKQLSADGLFQSIHRDFQDVDDHRKGKTTVNIADALMSGLAMFSLKEPSMLAFEQRRKRDENNLQKIFHVQKVPSDTTMREVLDPVDPEQLRTAFKTVFG